MYARLISFLLQLILWFLFLGIPLFHDPRHIADSDQITHYILRHSLYVLLYYLNYFYFIPTILKKKGLGIYALYVLFSFVIVFMGALFFEEGLAPMEKFSGRVFFGLIPIIQVYAISTTFRLVIDYFEQLSTQKKMEEQNRLAELNFLRSQINPHFLFNTLNNINALVRMRPAEAEKSIGALSDLMRYMLNCSKHEKMELGKEIEYINNYVKLQKLRLPKEFNLKYETKVADPTVLIEPLLLIGFIENTFKHGVSGSDDDFIEISIRATEQQLELHAVNKIYQFKNTENIVSGIGMENTKKRLQFCYKNNYSIYLQAEDGIYDIKLILNL